MSEKIYAYRVKGSDWMHFKSEWVHTAIRYIAEDALEHFANDCCEYDFSDLEIEIAIRCHSYSFFGYVENCPVFTAVKRTKEIKK